MTPERPEQREEEPVKVNVEVPESDVLEQALPANHETPSGPRATYTRGPREFIPEADAQEQDLAADREEFDD